MSLESCDVIEENKINCDWLDLAVTSTKIVFYVGFERCMVPFYRLFTSLCKNQCVKEYFEKTGLNGHGMLFRMLHIVVFPFFWLLN
jgi:hypothetical protein